MYRDINSPYPGSVSNKISCQEKYKPQEIENHYELYSNERLNYGVCSEDLIKYKTYLQFLKCNEEFYTIELFIPIDQKIEFIEFECK